MEQALWNRIEELLQAALDREPDGRAAFLDQAIGADPGLRAHVEALLAQERYAPLLSVSPVPEAVAQPPAFSAALTGQTLGRYRVIRRIGAGGMGEVYEAHDEQLQRTVALKALPEELVNEDRAWRFEREALAVSGLNHPNIITIFEVVHGGQSPFIVAEHVEGRTLRELLTDPQSGAPRALPVDEAVAIATQVAAALEAAHTAWIIHRDIKPENVMVRSDGVVKVVDFGIAKQSDPARPDHGRSATAVSHRANDHGYQTVAGAVLGTRGYMSPEQARGEPLDGRTDLFSFGLVLYEMVTGERYSAGAEQVDGSPPRSGRLPGEMRDIVRRLLQVRREDRYPSAAELLADLERVSARASRRSARRLAVTGAIAILAAAAIATLAAVFSVSEEWEESVLRDGHTAAARQAAFSPDGRVLASCSEDGQVIVWDFARRQRLATLTGQKAHKIAFSPDGRWLVTGGVDGTLRVLDAQRLVEVRTLQGSRGEIGALGFSQDGRAMLSSGARNEIWATGTWKRKGAWPEGVSHGAVLFSRERPQVALPGWRVFGLADGRLLSTEPRIQANWAALSPDGSRLATIGARGEVAFYRLDRADLRHPALLARSRGHQDHGRAIAFSPDGRLVASGAEVTLLWDAATHRKIARLEHSSIVWSLAFHPSGRWLVSSHGDGAVLVWDVAERELVANLGEHSGAVRSVAFAADGRRVVSGGEDRSVVLWDGRTQRKLAVHAGHETRVTGVAFLPASGAVASVDQDGVVILWDVARRRPRATIRQPEWSAAYTLAISLDGGLLATSHGIYATADGRAIARFQGTPDWRYGSVYGAAFSPDGRRLACVTDAGWILSFDASGGRLLEQRRLPETHLIAIDLSEDGEWLVTGEDEGAIRLWSVSPLRQVAVLGRHAARVKAVAFSPQGEVVASAGDDKTIALWDVARRRMRATIGTHASPIYSIAFSPDGRRLVSGEHDRTVRLYTRRRSVWGVPLD